MAARFEQRARQARQRAEVIRQVLASANVQEDAPTSGEGHHAARTALEGAAQEQASAPE